MKKKQKNKFAWLLSVLRQQGTPRSVVVKALDITDDTVRGV